MRFYTFIPSHTLLRSVLHFFPSTERIAAPYPVSCKITFFQERSVIRSLALDGLRLSQPDGVKIEDLLTGAEGESLHGIIGVEVELDTKGRNTDLSLSDCIVEIECQEYSVQYRAIPQRGKGTGVTLPCDVAGGGEHHASFVFINSSEEERRVSYRLLPGEESEDAGNEIVLAPRQVLERSALIQNEEQARLIGFDEGALPDSVFGYMMYRDVKSNLPLSVCQL